MAVGCKIDEETVVSVAAPRRQIQVSYAWVIVATAFLTLMANSGVRFGFGLFFKPLEEAFGWDKTILSLAVSINMLVYGLTQPLAGHLADRYGPKRVILSGLVLAGIGMALLSQTRSVWHLYLLYGVLVAAGASNMAFVPQAALVNRWFVRRRSLGMGLAFAGSSAGQLVMMPSILFLLTTSGWQTSFLMLGLGLLLVVAPMTLLLVRDRPKTVSALAAASAEVAASSLGIGQALRTRTFWLLAGGYSTCGFSITTIGIHLPSYVDDLGLTQGVAALALSLIGILSFTGSIVAGLLATWFDRKTLLAATYFLRGTSVVMLLLAANPFFLWLFVLVVGLSWVATVPLTSALVAARFGPASMATIFGVVSMSHQAGDALGVFLGGFLRDLTGSYEAPFMLVAAALFAASVVSYLIEEPKMRVPQATAVAT